jgi:TfoX/Sxy family transcriptional regulator of competence genes
MAETTIPELEQALDAAASGLKETTRKKMFGCYALWAKGNVFAMVWKHGRIGVKLPDQASFDALMKASGSEPWKAGPMTMSHWVLVPKSFHAGRGDLETWVGRAHDQCSKLEAKAKKPATAKAGSAAKAGTKK